MVSTQGEREFFNTIYSHVETTVEALEIYDEFRRP